MDTVSGVLRRLTNRGGQYVSGQALAAELGVSRNAVWKAVETLRARGCLIEATPRRGYRLQWSPDVPDEAAVLSALTGSLFRRVIYLPETGSTNDLAKQEARAGAPEGTVVVADYQTSGRGRRGRAWVSPPGAGLSFSIVLRPSVHPRQAPLLVFLAAAAVREVIAGLASGHAGARANEDDGDSESNETCSSNEADGDQCPVLIKWPNDVVAGGRKVCGVLLELNAELEQVHWCVMGVGVNVNHTADDFPVELEQHATSVRALVGHRVRRVPLLQRILLGIARRYQWALQYGFDQLLEETRRHSATIGHDVKIFEADGSDWDGYALDIQDDGALLVRPTAGGSPVPVYAADVSVRREGDDGLAE